MAKFYDSIGFAYQEEGTGSHEGVALDRTIEYRYYGDVLRNTRKWEAGSDIHDNLVINNQISIVADDFAYSHLFAMKYVRWMGNLWSITNVEPQRPRILITLGGVYNGPTPGDAA